MATAQRRETAEEIIITFAVLIYICYVALFLV
jgi:hypothetical protein